MVMMKEDRRMIGRRKLRPHKLTTARSRQSQAR
jgi:hypothetical protein